MVYDRCGDVMKLLGATRYLRVADVEQSLKFYRDALGFTVSNHLEEDGHTFWAQVANNAFTLMLSDRPSRFVDDAGHEDEHEHDDEGHHIFRGIESAAAGELNLVTFLYVASADEAYRELLASGVTPLDEPADTFYGLREFLVRDPDGYYYAIGSRIA